jgi:hypothetical protein
VVMGAMQLHVLLVISLINYKRKEKVKLNILFILGVVCKRICGYGCNGCS